MATTGSVLTAPSTTLSTNTEWQNELAYTEAARYGYDGVSLTEWASGNTTKPEIAAGSVIEIDGAMCEYDSDTTLTDDGSLVDGWCYIKHVVSGATITPTLTNTWGTWDTAKQGYYDGSGNRYSLFAMYRSGAVTKIFTEKSNLIKGQNNIIQKVMLNGNIFRIPKLHIFSASDTYGTLYDTLDLEIPSVGDYIRIDGDAIGSSADRFNRYYLRYITRASTTTMTLSFSLEQFVLSGGAPSGVLLTSGNRTLSSGSSTTIASGIYSGASGYGDIMVNSNLYGT